MQETLVQLNLDDLLEKILERDRSKKKYGCVLRALGSLLKAQPTEEQWDRRFADLSRLGVPNNKRILNLVNGWKRPQSFQEEVELEELRKQDKAQIINMLREIGSSETPMGDALKRYRWFLELMTQEDIKRVLLSEENKILLLTYNHLVHLGYDRSKNVLVRLSDNNYKEDLLRGVYYTVFRFIKR